MRLYKVLLALLIMSTIGFGQMDIKNSFRGKKLMYSSPPLHNQRGGQLDDRMEMMKIWRMTEYLELSSEQAEQFFPLLKEHRLNIKNIYDNKYELENRIIDNLDNEVELTKAELDQFLEQLTAFDQEIQIERQDYLLRFTHILNTNQIAKLALFGRVFRSEIMDHMRFPPRRNRKD